MAWSNRNAVRQANVGILQLRRHDLPQSTEVAVSISPQGLLVVQWWTRLEKFGSDVYNSEALHNNATVPQRRCKMVELV